MLYTQSKLISNCMKMYNIDIAFSKQCSNDICLKNASKFVTIMMCKTL